MIQNSLERPRLLKVWPFTLLDRPVIKDWIFWLWVATVLVAFVSSNRGSSLTTDGYNLVSGLGDALFALVINSVVWIGIPGSIRRRIRKSNLKTKSFGNDDAGKSHHYRSESVFDVSAWDQETLTIVLSKLSGKQRDDDRYRYEFDGQNLRPTDPGQDDKFQAFVKSLLAHPMSTEDPITQAESKEILYSLYTWSDEQVSKLTADLIRAGIPFLMEGSDLVVDTQFEEAADPIVARYEP